MKYPSFIIIDDGKFDPKEFEQNCAQHFEKYEILFATNRTFEGLSSTRVFETKETLVNKNKNGNVIHSERLSRNIHLTPPLSLSSSHTAYINRVQNDIKLDDTLIDSFNYIHCRNCFAFLAKESKILYNN